MSIGVYVYTLPFGKLGKNRLCPLCRGEVAKASGSTTTRSRKGQTYRSQNGSPFTTSY